MIPHKKSADFYLLTHYSSVLYLIDTPNKHVPACPELLIYSVITSSVNLVLGGFCLFFCSAAFFSFESALFPAGLKLSGSCPESGLLSLALQKGND